MTLQELLQKLQFSEEVCGEILNLSLPFSEKELKGYCTRLCNPEGYRAAYEQLQATLVNDEKGFIMLSVMLHAALLSLERYQKRGIGEEIFIDTMKCFARFVGEHKVSFGYYGFDRGFWTGRQLSLSLFRLGMLEYELAENNDIAIHIPSGSDLSDGALRKSFDLAKAFFKEQNIPVRRYVCGSWLLSPALKELLPAQSKILNFQSKFRIIEYDRESDGYKLWVFKRKDIPPEEFPEDTSLQRTLKQYVLAGGKIGEAFGELFTI